jgi:quercetin dioxygenase-like cupin family protein
MSTPNPGPESSPQPSGLPPFTTHITTHDEQSGKAIIRSSIPGALQPWDASTRPTFNYLIPHSTSSFPIQLSSDADLTAHDSLLASGFKNVVLPGGTNLRVLELPPAYESVMHRTVSLDYGVVTEGELELVLDGGETRKMGRGDLVVQRGTMHAWRNPSAEEWARVVFVVVDAERLVVGGRELGEQWGLE